MPLTDTDIEATIAEVKQPVIVEFHGKGCRPCVTQEDILAHAASRPNFPARVVSINVEDQPEYAERFGVKMVPSVVLLQPGKQPRKFTGLIDAGSVISAIETHQAG